MGYHTRRLLGDLKELIIQKTRDYNTPFVPLYRIFLPDACPLRKLVNSGHNIKFVKFYIIFPKLPLVLLGLVNSISLHLIIVVG